MKKRLRRIRGAVGMGLAWAVGWGFVGVLIGLCVAFLPGLPMEFREALADFLDPWPALALPGFFGGVLFSAVLRIAEGGRRFDELTLLRCGTWGAVTGVLLSLFPAAMVLAGLASVVGDAHLWRDTAVIIGPVTLLSAVSAVGPALWFRYSARTRDSAADG